MGHCVMVNIPSEYLNLCNMLTSRGVPDSLYGRELSLWDRVDLYGKDYLIYQPKSDGDVTPIDLSKSIVTANFKPFPVEIEKIAPALEFLGDQEMAWGKIESWLKQKEDPYFVLKGPAGTGKTHLLYMLSLLKQHKVHFCAPTNKATKVLSKLVQTEAKTIYSLLGLRMEQKEDKLELTIPKNRPHIKRGSIIVLDECSMVGSQLLDILFEAVALYGIKILFSGDSYQLPPIGEKASKAWKTTVNPNHRANMRKVIRFGDQILGMALRIRKVIKDRNFSAQPPIYSDNDGTKGIWALDDFDFKKRLLTEADAPEVFRDIKVICWRNKTVDYWTKLIRKKLGFTKSYEVGDLLMLAAPYMDGDDILAHIDDEGVVLEVSQGNYTVDGIKVPVYFVLLDLGDNRLQLRIPIKEDDTLDRYLAILAKDARNSRKNYERALLWKKFWGVKNQFHSCRFSYSLTCHRIQGTTLTTTYTCVSDIMANMLNPLESYQCLLTGTTRATTRVITN